MVKIVIDTLGSDNGYKPSVEGSIKAINELDDLSLVLVGKIDELEEELSNYSYDKNRITLLDSKQIITNHDHPVEAIITKKESSMVVGLNYLKTDEEAMGLLTASSTGALLVGSTIILGRMLHLRPALATLLPNSKGTMSVLMDCGANIDSTPEMMLSYGLMGSALYKAYYLKDNPTVALLSNGSEEGKGNTLVKESYKLLKESKLNFIGNAEGTDALDGEKDVIVSDGFSGNVFLKTVEGAAKAVIKDCFKYAKMENNKEFAKLGQKLAFDYDLTSRGGAILIGTNKVVMKGHGNANIDTWYNCIKICYKLIKNNIIENIRNNVEEGTR